MRNKWQMNRAGVLNYWYYDEEEFDFADGRLLLRGSNGSGKSVTMQSLITVLLDGVKSPDRLDSFGSRSRRMEDYLLGEKEIVNRDERTGYLYLEYKRQQTDQFVTTGIGLHARRGGTVDFWGFVITDNRRIGRDFWLYKREMNPEDGSPQRIPFTRAELERAVGSGGQVVRSQKDYMELVNRHVFGFENLEQYQELMKLLIQLRSPKLSKNFKPSVIYEILNESLPSLSDEELRPLSDTIESMERIKLQIEQMERDRQALNRLCRQYDGYNEYVLAEKADLAQKAERRHSRLEREGKELAEGLAEAAGLLTEQRRSQAELERELTVLEVEKAELEKHDVFQVEQQKQAKEQQLDQLEGEQKNRQAKLAERQKGEREERQLVLEYEGQRETFRQGMEEQLEDMAALAAEADFSDHELLARDFAAQPAKVSFGGWRQNSQSHVARLEAGLQVLRRQREARLRRDRIEQELGEERKLLDEYRGEYRKLEQRFLEVREQLLADVYSWQQRYDADLPLEKEELRQIAQGIQGLYEGRLWSDVQAPLDTAYGRQVDRLNQELGLNGARLRQLEEQEQGLQQELQSWRDQRDPEPERLPDVEATRRLLAEKQVPFVPFYAAVEFDSRVTPTMRERLEAALTDMGLLDALIVPAGRLPELSGLEAYGSVFYPDPQIMTATLADYLQPTPPADGKVSAADIDEVLRSILIDDCRPGTGPAANGSNQPVLSADSGGYRLNLVSGRASRRQSAVYIGRQARQEYRRRQMAELEEKLRETALAVEEVHGKMQLLRNRQEKNRQAREDFPAETEIREIFHNKQAVTANIVRQEQRVNVVDGRLREVTGEVLSLRQEWQKVSAGLKLPADEAGYEGAVSVMRQYQQGLHELELSRQGFLNSSDNARQCGRRLADLSAEVDGLKGELLVQEGRLQTLRLEIDRLESRMREMGAAELRERVRFVAKRLKEIPAAIKELIAAAAKLEGDIRLQESRKLEVAAKTQFVGQLIVCWQQLLKQELQLGLVYPPDETTDSGGILRDKGGWLKPDKPDRTSLTDRISKSFAVENNVLMEYRMQLEPLTVEIKAVPVLPENREEDDGLAADLEKLREKSHRLVITLDYDGRRQNPYQLQQVLNRQIEEQKAILSDKDKELYEEVIMNSIGRIISRRIRSAQQWVEKMNNLMQQRDNSSGLKFKLEWKARTADRDEELDTQDLVRLLHADPAVLKEEDLAKMVSHFQSRIQQAKQASEGAAGEAEATFQQAVRQLLDYRLWFQFKLQYTQGNLSWRELSDKVFFKFSGGEKAMAMYIPLFSAAYSRYQEAGLDAPFIITLDEAFAGVDENNIRDTFALVEQLGFNYIMNSQALWGDYDVVPSLAVCELIRPQNAPYVTVVRYHWNGSVRTLQAAGEAEQAASLAAAARQVEQ
ncbi:MAG: TIGR02680 family protein [Veillonellales bacterium]